MSSKVILKDILVIVKVKLSASRTKGEGMKYIFFKHCQGMVGSSSSQFSSREQWAQELLLPKGRQKYFTPDTIHH